MSKFLDSDGKNFLTSDITGAAIHPVESHCDCGKASFLPIPGVGFASASAAIDSQIDTICKMAEGIYSTHLSNGLAVDIDWAVKQAWKIWEEVNKLVDADFDEQINKLYSDEDEPEDV